MSRRLSRAVPILILGAALALPGGIKFMRTPQGQLCGNTMSGNTGGHSVGAYGADFDPTGSC